MANDLSIGNGASGVRLPAGASAEVSAGSAASNVRSLGSSSAAGAAVMGFDRLLLAQAAPLLNGPLLNGPLANVSALQILGNLAQTLSEQVNELTGKAITSLDSLLSKLAVQSINLQTAELSGLPLTRSFQSNPLSISELNSPQLRRELLATLSGKQSFDSGSVLRQWLNSAVTLIENAVPGARVKERFDAICADALGTRSAEVRGEANLVQAPVFQSQPVQSPLVQSAAERNRNAGHSATPARPLPYSKSDRETRSNNRTNSNRTLSFLLRLARNGAEGIRRMVSG